MKAKLLILLFMIPLIVACNFNPLQEKEFEKLKINTAIQSADSINKLNLSIINTSSVTSIQGIESFLENTNTIIAVINEKTDYKIKQISITREMVNELSEKGDIVLRFTPIIQPYNELINISKSINATNKNLTNKFYWSVSLLAVDVTILEMDLGRKITVSSSRSLLIYIEKENPDLWLTIKKYCGSECYYEIEKRAGGTLNKVIIASIPKISYVIKNITQNVNLTSKIFNFSSYSLNLNST